MIACAIVLLPIGWMVTVALKPDGVPAFDSGRVVPDALLRVRQLRARAHLPDRPFGLYIVNTLIIFAGSVVGTMLSCCSLATRSPGCGSAGESGCSSC